MRGCLVNDDKAPGDSRSSGRILALDPGRRRTGIALSDPAGSLASPLETVSLPLRSLLQHIRGLIAEHAVYCVLIGYPRLPSGDPGEIAALSEEIALRLRRSTDVEVVLWDETLSSWEAERLLSESSARRRRDRGAVDRLAAALILQDYLDHRGSSGVESVESPDE